MSTKLVGNNKKEKVRTGLKAECPLLEKESGDGHSFLWFMILFLLLEGFAFAFAVMLTMATDYNYRGVNNDSVSWCGRG